MTDVRLPCGFAARMRPWSLILSVFVWLQLASGQVEEFRRATELLEAGRVEEAHQLVTEAVRKYPAAEPFHALLGQIAFTREQYPTAVEHFQKSAGYVTQNPLLSLNYAEALLKVKSVDAARSVLQRLPKDDATLHFDAGLLLADAGEFAEAAKHFELAQPGYPKPETVAYNLALAQHKTRQIDACVTTLENARNRGVVSGDILNLLWEAYVELGQPRKALDVLSEAAKVNPKEERIYVAAARLSIDLNEPTVGLKLLDHGLSYLPDSYPLLMERAYARLSQALYDDAEEDYRAAMKVRPESHSALIGLAFVFFQSQRQTEATGLLEQAIQSEPSDYFPYYLLGELRIREGRDQDALKFTERAAALEAEFAPIHTNLGKLYVKQQDYPAAIRALEKATEINPEDAAAYYQLSIAYQKLGDKENSRKALAQVRHLNRRQREQGAKPLYTAKIRKALSGQSGPPD